MRMQARTQTTSTRNKKRKKPGRRVANKVRYYDLVKNWRKVRKHLADKELNDIQVRDFHKFTWGRWRRPFRHGMCPNEFEGCDWQIGHRGKYPAYWRYVKHAACHWLVNFALRLAMLVEPDRPWRIITTPKHSTVWDGDRLLLDLNFQAMGVSPRECFLLGYGRELAPGAILQVSYADHYSRDRRRNTVRRRRKV